MGFRPTGPPIVSFAAAFWPPLPAVGIGAAAALFAEVAEVAEVARDESDTAAGAPVPPWEEGGVGRVGYGMDRVVSCLVELLLLTPGLSAIRSL